jgi:hypothetical protein
LFEPFLFRPALVVAHDNLDGQPTLKDAAEFFAAHNARLGYHTFNVFQYQGSTYVFNDWHGNQKIDPGDGLIKLVGVSSHGPQDFVTPSEFIM